MRLSLFLPLLFAFLYESLPINNDNDNDSIQGNVLFLTAHPDDECLFFAPTIRSLIRQTNASLYSLCLSIGDADRLGQVRRKELAASLAVLGIPTNHSWVLDHPHLQDNFTAFWNTTIISQVIQPYIIRHNITTILTFDNHGVSGHPNHCSLSAVAPHLKHLPSHFYTLTTRSLPEKYIGILAPLASKVSFYSYTYINTLVNILGIPLNLAVPTHTHKFPRLFISGFSDYLTALSAMRAHSTQLVWFRWLYVLFSRYMWVNEWVEI